MKPICVKCQRFYRLRKAGYCFIEAMPAAGVKRAAAGTTAPEQWTPYKLWSGDLWRCEGCEHELISGVGGGPIAEHYQPDFAERTTQLNGAQLQVNDC